jgi:hypothetical protein
MGPALTALSNERGDHASFVYLLNILTESQVDGNYNLSNG